MDPKTVTNSSSLGIWVAVWSFVLALFVNAGVIFFWAGQVSSAVDSIADATRVNAQAIDQLRTLHMDRTDK